MKKIYGTTLFIGSSEIETQYGKFTTFVFQDIIDIKYIFALVHGDLSKNDFYIRLHSSCLTSETLRSMDCDCVQQLNAALETIVKKGNGILFYLLQSGRGASYVSKSRGCQMVQYQEDTITTFDAYEQMGLKHDYRDYRNVKDICVILDIYEKDFYLMTNNPDKINKIKELGFNIKDIISVEFPPNPFNRKYLESKKDTGHKLTKLMEELIDESKQPSIKPFEPYHLPQKRFIHCASYYLPIEPVNNLILVDSEPINTEFERTKDGKFLIKSDELKPYWFKVDVYYDIAKHGETMVLTYNEKVQIPIVRIHSEFIFNRFPLKDDTYKSKYSTAIYECVKNGGGIIIVANHNGHDYNIGNFIIDQDEEGFEKTGITKKRNLLPVTLLLKHHLKGRKIKMFYSDGSRLEMERSFEKGDIEVDEWECIDPNDSKGHYILQQRIKNSHFYLSQLQKPNISFENNIWYLVSGIGTSESHAKYLVYNSNNKYFNMKFVPINGINKEICNRFDKLILFSQGLSPHGIKPINYFKKENIILFTSVTSKNSNPEKINIYNKAGTIINYPLEDEYDILIRTLGPICGFGIIDKIFNINNSLNSWYIIPNDFIKDILEKQSITLIINYPLTEYYQNLEYKFIEGAFIKTVNVVDQLGFAHGYYQNTECWDSCFILINLNNDNINNILKDKSLFTIKSKSIIEIEHIINIMILKLVRLANIDQRCWPGKNTQNFIYNT
jgi:3,4-dihydroxy 2-butanone 4-phosphate synthase / GTP cyclohydrolase II